MPVAKRKSQMTAAERLQAKQETADAARAANPLESIMTRLRSTDLPADQFAKLAAAAYNLIESEADGE